MFTKFTDQIKHLAALRDNWDDEGAKAPSEETLFMTGFIVGLRYASDQKMPYSINPLHHGGVDIEYRYNVKDDDKSYDYEQFGIQGLSTFDVLFGIENKEFSIQEFSEAMNDHKMSLSELIDFIKGT